MRPDLHGLLELPAKDKPHKDEAHMDKDMAHMDDDMDKDEAHMGAPSLVAMASLVDKEEDADCLKLLHARAPHIASSYMTLTVHVLKEYARGCLGWKGKRVTQNKPLLKAEHLSWEQEMEEDQLAEVAELCSRSKTTSAEGQPRGEVDGVRDETKEISHTGPAELGGGASKRRKIAARRRRAQKRQQVHGNYSGFYDELPDGAEVQRLRGVEQSLMGTVDGLQGDLDDLQATHQGLHGTTPELAVPAGAPPQQQQQLATASTSRKREAPAANKSRAAKRGASHNSVAKRAGAARLAWGETA
ncbi:hypothetical protein QJQ45_007712 [Haematococcus lacustris]|nr:hypothetical protein QJQ45_007712 [Haematococcus lacustris]